MWRWLDLGRGSDAVVAQGKTGGVLVVETWVVAV